MKQDQNNETDKVVEIQWVGRTGESPSINLNDYFNVTVVVTGIS